MMTDQDREFYVGYLPESPPLLGRIVPQVVGSLIVVAIAVAMVLASSQSTFSPATFEFGQIRTFEGTPTLDPVPSLLVARPGLTNEQTQVSRYLLTSPGKHGAHEVIAQNLGISTTLEGTLVYRDGMTMLEIVPGSLAPSTAPVLSGPVPTSHGMVTLSGEIVDGKCYLGVMNPGEGKPHRACAARCISGGAPPILIVRTETGGHRHLVMFGYETANLLAFVAEPVEVSGELIQSGDTWMLSVAAGSIRRLL